MSIKVIGFLVSLVGIILGNTLLGISEDVSLASIEGLGNGILFSSMLIIVGILATWINEDIRRDEQRKDKLRGVKDE